MMTVDIFIPCFIDQIYPQTGFNMIKILEKFDVDVYYNENQTCCGQISFNSGFWDDAKAIGEKFILEFNHNRPLVVPSASCAGFVRNYYGELFLNTGLHLEFRQLQKNIIEFTDFLVNVLKVTDLGATFEHKVTYHDSCAALREYKLNNEPRSLLETVKGLELVEMKDVELPENMQRAMAKEAEAVREKRARIIKAEAEYEASQKLSEAAKEIARNPMSLELRRMQMITEVGAEQNTTTIMLMPSEFMNMAQAIADKLKADKT